MQIIANENNSKENLIDYLGLLLSQRNVETHFSAKYFLYGCLALIGGSAGIPGIKIAARFSENRIISYLECYGFITTLGALNIWGLFDFIKYLEAVADMNSSMSTHVKLSKGLISIFLGALTSSPWIPINYRYNNSVFLTGQGYICDTILISCVYQRILLSLKLDAIETSYQDSKAKEIVILLIERMQTGVKVLVNANLLEQKTFFDDLGSSVSLNNPDQNAICKVVARLVELATPVVTARKNFKKRGTDCSRSILEYMVVPLLPLIWGFVNWMASSSGLYAILGNYLLGTLLAALPVIFLILLEIILTKTIILSLFDLILDFLATTYLKDTSTQYYPKIQFTLLLWGLFTAALSFPTRAQVARDYLPEDTKQVLIPCLIVVTIILKSSSLLSLINNVMHFFIRKNSTDTIADLAKLQQVVNKFQLACEVAPKNKIMKFCVDMLAQLDDCSLDFELAEKLEEFRNLEKSSNKDCVSWCSFFKEHQALPVEVELQEISRYKETLTEIEYCNELSMR